MKNCFSLASVSFPRAYALLFLGRHAMFFFKKNTGKTRACLPKMIFYIGMGPLFCFSICVQFFWDGRVVKLAITIITTLCLYFSYFFLVKYRWGNEVGNFWRSSLLSPKKIIIRRATRPLAIRPRLAGFISKIYCSSRFPAKQAGEQINLLNCRIFLIAHDHDQKKGRIRRNCVTATRGRREGTNYTYFCFPHIHLVSTK